MKTQALTKFTDRGPSIFEDFFKPWNELFDYGNLWNKVMDMPAVNIAEHKDQYLVSLAAPGMKKDDFKIDLDDNLLTISSEKEENKEEKDEKFTRKEYNYSSFSRTFTLPDGANKEKIEAKYEDGVLKISIPRNKEAKISPVRRVAIK